MYAAQLHLFRCRYQHPSQCSIRRAPSRGPSLSPARSLSLPPPRIFPDGLYVEQLCKESATVSNLCQKTKDLDLRKPGARRPGKRFEFETTIKEVLEKANFRVRLFDFLSIILMRILHLCMCICIEVVKAHNFRNYSMLVFRIYWHTFYSVLDW
ncbi:hypothetical protein ACS0TY_031551 [Phlomoides rotata]